MRWERVDKFPATSIRFTPSYFSHCLNEGMFWNEIRMWKRIQKEVGKEEEKNERKQKNILKQFLSEKC
jgi:hypothetical protein